MKKAALVVLAVMALGVAQVAMAQATGTTTITAVKAETLTIAASAVPDFAINALGTGSVTDQDLVITTNWNLMPTRNTVKVCAGITTAGLLASNPSNTDSIPVGAVHASTGTTFAAINAAAGCGATGLVTTVSTNDVSAIGRKNKGVSDTLHLRLVGVDPALQADTYTGTITVYAQVTP